MLFRSMTRTESTAPASSLEVRARLVEALKLDLVGPSARHALAEERLRGWERPSNWYLTGFLIPMGTPPERSADADEDDDGRRSRFRRLAKRLMDRRELGNETKVLLTSALAASDKAKTEGVKMIARELRSYLEALELKKDLKELATSYSLEISVSLKPLASLIPDDEEPEEA
mgnify:CR=1 FL=1